MKSLEVKGLYVDINNSLQKTEKAFQSVTIKKPCKWKEIC